MYMSGFFPCMMFGIPGAALAMIKCAKPEKKKLAIGLIASAALCSFICGVTEPFEFGFMFLAPVLYVIYALLYGIFTMITVALGFRAGFSFSAGAMDLIFSSSLPAAQKTWLILPRKMPHPLHIPKDLTERLPQIDHHLAEEVRDILDINKSERHIRGGMATRQKYLLLHRVN